MTHPNEAALEALEELFRRALRVGDHPLATESTKAKNHRMEIARDTIRAALRSETEVGEYLTEKEVEEIQSEAWKEGFDEVAAGAKSASNDLFKWSVQELQKRGHLNDCGSEGEEGMFTADDIIQAFREVPASEAEVQPVAWQWRTRAAPHLNWGAWRDGRALPNIPMDVERLIEWEERPLYAAPLPSPQGVVIDPNDLEVVLSFYVSNGGINQDRIKRLSAALSQGEGGA